MKPIIKEKSAVPEGDGMATKIVDRGVPVRRYFTLIGLGLALVLIIALVVLAGLIYRNTKVNKTSQNVPSVKEIIAGIEDKLEDPVSDNSDPNVDDKHVVNEPVAPQNDVEVNITYHIWQTGENIQENIAVSGNEEIITTPDARIVYDYDSGLRVTKLVADETDVCFVADFNITGSIERLKTLLQKKKTDRYVTNKTHVRYVITDIPVNDTTLSPTASDMCDGSRLVWVKQTTDEVGEQMKRDCTFIQETVCNDVILTVKRSRQTCTRGWWGRRKCRTVYYTAYEIHTVCNDYWYLECN